MTAGSGSPAAPLFVVGASRSGTAMLRSMLNRHPEVFLAGETHYFDDLRVRLRDDAGFTDRRRRQCEDYFLALAHRPYGHGGEPRHSRMDRAELRARAAAFGDGPDAYFRAYCFLAQRLEDGSPATSAAIWGEKTPRHVFRLDDMLTCFPTAKVVCMYRDPRAVVASYRDWRNQGGFDLDEDAGHRAALEAEERRTRSSYDPTIASLLWKGTVTAGRAAERRFGRSHVRLQRYEDLVRSPDQNLRSICEWLGVAFDARMLDVPLHNSSVNTFSRDAGVSTAPLDRWRSSLSPAEVAVVQLWCGRELRALGYEEEPIRVTARMVAPLLLGVPRSLATALWVNRRRMGHVGPYLWRRLRTVLFSKG